MTVLLHRRREIAEAKITALAERRQQIADKLNNLHKVAKVIGGPNVNHEEVASLYGGEFTDRDPETRAIRFWLRYNGWSDLPIKDSAIRTAFHLPRKVDNLIQAVKDSGIIGGIKDPIQYANGDRFAPPPVTDEERAKIMEREEVRAQSEAVAELYQSVEKVVNLANLRNKTAGHDLITIGDLTTGPNVMYGGLIKKTKQGPHILDKPVFEVDGSAFDLVRIDYRAQDER